MVRWLGGSWNNYHNDDGDDDALFDGLGGLNGCAWGRIGLACWRE